MKNIIAIVFLSVAGFLASAQNSDPYAYTKVGDSTPVFSFEIEKGKTVSIKDYKGKLILINLFATWCPPCNVELPLVQEEIWNKHKDNPNFSIFVFGREEGWETLNLYKKAKGFTFPILPDLDKGVFSKFAEQSIPRNILIDGTGKIIYQSLGFDDEEFNQMVDLIDKILKEK